MGRQVRYNRINLYFVESLGKEFFNPLYGWHQGHYLVVEDASVGIERVMPVLEDPSALTIASPIEDFKQTIRIHLVEAK